MLDWALGTEAAIEADVIAASVPGALTLGTGTDVDVDAGVAAPSTLPEIGGGAGDLVDPLRTD